MEDLACFLCFRRIEISERKVACLFSMFFRRKEMSERKVACLFSMCFRRIEFLHKKKIKKLEIGLMM